MVPTMSIRIFNCPHCNHTPKFGARECHNCYRDTPFYNRIGFLLIVVLVVGYFSATAILG
jgi:hypothetical protein